MARYGKKGKGKGETWNGEKAENLKLILVLLGTALAVREVASFHTQWRNQSWAFATAKSIFAGTVEKTGKNRGNNRQKVQYMKLHRNTVA